MGLDNPALFTIFVDGTRGTAEPGDPSNPAGVYQPEFRQPLALSNFPTCKPGERAAQRCYENTYNGLGALCTAGRRVLRTRQVDYTDRLRVFSYIAGPGQAPSQYHFPLKYCA